MVKPLVLVTRGSLIHLMVPQSKTIVSTSDGRTRRSPGRSAISPPYRGLPTGSFLERKRFEFLNLFGDGPLRRKSLHARSSKEARDAARPAQYIDDIVRLGQRPAVADHQDLRVDRHRGVADGLDERHSLIERQGRPGADGSLGGQPRVCDD